MVKQRTISRRAFVATAAASVATPALAQLPSNPDVAIVGAGMAGIAAARALIAAGYEVVVLEARDRAGGRAFTETHNLGVPFDHGAAYLHGLDNNPLRDVAAELGIPITPDRMDLDPWLTGRGFAGKARLSGSRRRVTSALARSGRQRGDIQARDAFRPRSDMDRLAANLFGSIQYGTAFDRLSVIDTQSRDEKGASGIVASGLGRLVTNMADGLPIKLRHPVDQIEWQRNRVRLRTPGGTLTARAALITVPTGVLNAGRMKFLPNLPPWKREALSGLPMGHLNRIAVRLKRGAIDVEPGSWVPWRGPDGTVVLFHFHPFGQDIVVGTVGGSTAKLLETRRADAAYNLVRGAMIAIGGHIVASRIKPGVATRWGSHPWSQGAVSVLRPGAGDARQKLARPLAPLLYFAGEATDIGWQTQLPGAYRSGLRAAAEIKAQLK